MRLTYAEIYLKNLEHNLNAIKNFVRPGVKICVSVKADGYGHGAVQVAKAAVRCGAEFLAVATIPEGVELREAGIKKPVLVLSICQPSEMADLVEYNLTPFVGDAEYIDMIEKAVESAQNAAAKKTEKSTSKKKAKRFPVHLAVDTGMGRIGCLPEEASVLAKKISGSKYLSLGGMCTHFASADGTSKKAQSYAARQYRRFLAAVESVRAAGINPGIRHCSSSAALMDHSEWQFDMVRPGIIVYGYYPDKITEKYLEAKNTPLKLKPVMALVTGVSAVRPFSNGMSVSYGFTWTAQKSTSIGVLPIGYADGLLRRFASELKVSINGKNYPVRGRICMDQCMVDLGHDGKKIPRFTRAVIFGPEESGALQSADSLAAAVGTISYEVLTSVSKRVERVYIK